MARTLRIRPATGKLWGYTANESPYHYHRDGIHNAKTGNNAGDAAQLTVDGLIEVALNEFVVCRPDWRARSIRLRQLAIYSEALAEVHRASRSLTRAQEAAAACAAKYSITDEEAAGARQ